VSFLRGDLAAEAAVERLEIIWDGLGRREASDLPNHLPPRCDTVLRGPACRASSNVLRGDPALEAQPRLVPHNPNYAKPDPI